MKGECLLPQGQVHASVDLVWLSQVKLGFVRKNSTGPNDSPGPKWDSHEMGRVRNGMGTKWPLARNGTVRH